jgi:hypothetical protein
MMARHREDRYQDVAVILEDLASYERRGLLKCAESGSQIPQIAWAASGEETQNYVRPENDDEPAN